MRFGRARGFQLSTRLCALSAYLFLTACPDEGGGKNTNTADAGNQAVCGNGILEEGEECDNGAENSDLAPNACRSDCRHPRCGDGVADEGEACDGRDLAGQSCPDLVDPNAPAGEHFTGGVLACSNDCTLDPAGCTRCGNGLAEPGEECDGSDLAGQDCASAGNRQDGRLHCAEDCTFDISGCHTCGDGQVEPAEDCEPGLELTETCQDLGWAWGELACNPDTCRYDVSGCRSVCGNGTREPDEDCDGPDLPAVSCTDFGFLGGRIVCSPACHLDLSQCSLCGNGRWDPDHGEECDGTDLAGQSCESLTGAPGGTLTCTPGCHLDTSGCQMGTQCGNGILEPGEECDGTNLGSATCETVRGGLLYTGGLLRCTGNCTFDTSGCIPASHCGNGLLETQFGEVCDGTELADKTCSDFGLSPGELGCTHDCRFDTSRCGSAASCGNGMIDEGEDCDGTQLGRATCTSLGFHGGTLTCTDQCTYDTSGCTTCGDGLVNGPGEQCDGADLAGQDCTSLGYDGGQLSCSETCHFDVSGCTGLGFCGNGIKDRYELCDGDDFGGRTCTDLGYYDGQLHSRPDCTYDTSDCVPAPAGECGNGVLEPGEVCDDGNDIDWDGCTQCQYREIAVSEGFTLYQSPKIALLPDGRFVVSWWHANCDQRPCVRNGVYIRRFHADGAPDGSTWHEPDSEQWWGFGFAAWRDGGLLFGDAAATRASVRFAAYAPDGSRRYSFERTPSTSWAPIQGLATTGGEAIAAWLDTSLHVLVLDGTGTTTTEWSVPAVQQTPFALSWDGSHLWMAYASSSGVLEIAKARLDGTVEWSAQWSARTDTETVVDVAQAANGGVWVLWLSQARELTLSQFDSLGTLVFQEEIVASSWHWFHRTFSLDSGEDGRVVVVWKETLGNGLHVLSQVFGPNGDHWSPQLKLSDYECYDWPDPPKVALHTVLGYFVVTWHTLLPGGHVIVMRAFAPDGSPLGPPPWQ